MLHPCRRGWRPIRASRSDDDFARTFTMPELDTSLWRVAWDGDQVAGVVTSWIWRDENEALGVRHGWLEHISVRRPWRRRGLAKALIASALVGLWEAGMNEAMLRRGHRESQRRRRAI